MLTYADVCWRMQALERLRIDEGRCVAAVAGLRRIAAAVGLKPVSGVSGVSILLVQKYLLY
jgi:hypothetical protein